MTSTPSSQECPQNADNRLSCATVPPGAWAASGRQAEGNRTAGFVPRRKADLRTTDHRTRRRTLCIALAGAFALGGVGSAAAAPSSVAAARAQVAQIERDLSAIDAKVGHAAEAYNGARWRLEVVQKRIAVNQENLAKAARSLTKARGTLIRRVRQIYKHGRPTTAEILISGGSIVSLVDQTAVLRRIERQDVRLVDEIRDYRTKARKARARLLVDRKTSQAEVADSLRAKARVEALLRRRQAVLASARGELGRLLAAERARERRQAEVARQRALAAQATPSAGASAPSAGEAPTGPLPSGDGNAAAVRVMMQYLGVPYVWGGASPSGFDCSGLASYGYAQIGKSVPHYTGAIWAAFPKVPRDQLQPGDMVFFNGLGHMGIYIGGDQMVHAPHTGDVVKVTSISTRSDYVGAVRP
jgi:peptidoglycan DL-endopeptidase CwlO